MNPIPSFHKVAMTAALGKDMQLVGNPNFPNPRGANPATTVAPPTELSRNVMIEDPALHGNGNIPTRYLTN